MTSSTPPGSPPTRSPTRAAAWTARKRASLGVDPGIVETLIAARREARTARNWAESDRIRDELAGLGVVVQDNKDGTTTWEVAR